ncbi:inosine/xanthosine triphosphatase [Shewanella schlegeliana]|uniref:Inosine/xanthosine triphosphatase n=1 Tax=Shewanella schlegeliana TaxID=190308 RepID=A0ABS1SXZ6_9GAMM|nr:inosine/xanthosine triphosphatase [Shewanella schlegeliana]MBL4912437.1 inosine/xanthosine triphosphatase [Shewanella schlegeliana]MCL1108093.1 inosine/xanthosine triphosphatase [Shewanella schlegeliana]GIU21757.1 non-canonical purine NTP phosphatase [Shewanella schlegeliana]
MKDTITVIVGSTNPVKVGAAQAALTTLFPDSDIECQGVSAPSLVRDQPMTEAETRLGAINRVKHCQARHQADFFLAMEGGVDQFEHGPATFAYIAIAYKKQVSIGRSALLPLPISVYQALTQGEELGSVMDKLFNTVNIKQKGGAIALLTNGHASRQSVYTQAIILAMAPILHPELYIN